MTEDLTNVSYEALQRELRYRAAQSEAAILARHSSYSVEELMAKKDLCEDAVEEADKELYPQLQTAKQQLSDLQNLEHRLIYAARDLRIWHEYCRDGE